MPFSCKKNNLLDENKLKEVLIKIHECEAYHEYKFSGANLPFLDECKLAALDETKVSREMFENTMATYKKNPKDLEKIYESIIAQTN